MPWSKNFDVDSALEKAGEAFWERGYEATSLRDLLDAMGIQKGSFYDTYGSKHEAYIRSLTAYADSRFAAFARLTEDVTPREGLAALINAVYQDCISPQGHRGCMIINCALELADHDPEAQVVVKRAFKVHARLFSSCIRAGQKSGEISPKLDAQATAQSMLGLVMGMRVYSRAGFPKTTIKTLAGQALALVDG